MYKLAFLFLFAAAVVTAQPKRWEHLSTAGKDLPVPFDGAKMQTSAMVVDLNNDGLKDFIVTCRNATPAIVAYLQQGRGWQKIVIENAMYTIEAGGAHTDIDADGDEDIVFGGDWQSNEVWWWENPYPAIEKATNWKRRLIKQFGEKQHHDQAVGDFKHLGKDQVVFWNQGAKTIFLAEVPKDPKQDLPWECKAIYTGASSGGAPYPEGMAVADVDSDGWPDLLAGNLWLRYSVATDQFTAIPFAQYGGRVAAGRLKPGPMQQIVLAPGDGSGPINWYECIGEPQDSASWIKHTISSKNLVHGHSLEVADMNGDGFMDIFSAEMAKWSEQQPLADNPNAHALIFYGNGKGDFKEEIVLSGFDFHEARVADLDGDGDKDILSKPYNWEVPRLDIWLQNGRAGRPQQTGAAVAAKLGLELYSVRNYMKEDIAGTLQKVYDMGIREVEIPEFYGKSATEFKIALDKAKLSYPSILYGYEKLRDSLEQVVKECKILGVKYAGCGWIPRKAPFDRALALSAAALFNTVGERLKKEGIRFFYHPHGYEFIPSPEGSLMDVLANAMKPGIADFELDILWSFYGGEDPVAFMNKHKGRILLMHVKDLRKGEPICLYNTLPNQENDVVVGTGQLAVADVLRRAVAEGVQHYFIEDESSRVLQQIPLTMSFIRALKY
jgi:sugar phosphate isomerase/epimerase